MKQHSSIADEVKQNTRTLLLIKDLFENCYPKDAEDLPMYWLGLSMFIAHTKDWNPGIEELGTNLLCRKADETIKELPTYNGPITRNGINEVLDMVVKPVIQKQQIGLLPKKNLLALSDHILKQYELPSGLRKKISIHLFVLAADIEGSEHQY